MNTRKASITRKTEETNVSIKIDIDGTGKSNISTSNGMFDHLLAQLSKHSLMDLTVSVTGDQEVGWHHIVEDTAISLGQALSKTIGNAKGIIRMGHAIVPLDESLAMVAVDVGGRGYTVLNTNLGDSDLGGLSGTLIEHFIDSLSRESGINIHVNLMYGSNNHHKAEAIFKALAKSLRAAMNHDQKVSNQIPSTKGVIG
ncbi:MAG: imidazoleglycerol-phosphate dehydratase HisB [SAR202 cluster bacterium]|nr:imidazoleglycerol-phosphate dehydratase HisB [SAR202 cluster bacterium]|tara:strand:+ start:7993 stop:8589 length:597 start_codon:yes stop_codon:yes gene_type:complete